MAVYDYVISTVESARCQANRIVSPDDRKKVYDSVNIFANDRPLLFSFILAQLLFALVPVLLFASIVLGTISLALFTAIASSLFWIGIFSLVLGSTLFITFALATLAWIWLVGAYVTGNFVYGLVAGNREVSGRDIKAKMEEKWASINKAPSTKDGKETNGVKQEDGGHGLLGEKSSSG
ncbi:hypothetical protein VMCG_10678 [Cytospora schulzeri]|uniref:Uncharacterized protein n=1 Tax=Cytospora schulzeri TaxID=448051 RepID=A0A423VAQ6_9PEZI|nr:hypothetical protein VMCG_10678 [Valsa malicola]